MTTEDAVQLGDRVKARREELGIRSMRAAAKRAGVSDDTWRRVERGDPTVSDTTLDAVARALETPGANVYEWAGRRYRPVAADPGSDALERLARIAGNITQLGEALSAEIRRLQQQGP